MKEKPGWAKPFCHFGGPPYKWHWFRLRPHQQGMLLEYTSLCNYYERNPVWADDEPQPADCCKVCLRKKQRMEAT